MNHFQDIDDGLEEYELTRARERDEAAFAQTPSLFSGDLGYEGDGDPFICASVHALHLTGGKFDRQNHPFSYDGGFAELDGRMKAGGPARVTLRWVGPYRETTIEHAS